MSLTAASVVSPLAVTALPATVRSCPALACNAPPALTVLAWLSVAVVRVVFLPFQPEYAVLSLLNALALMLMSFSATSCRSLPAVSLAPVLLMLLPAVSDSPLLAEMLATSPVRVSLKVNGGVLFLLVPGAAFHCWACVTLLMSPLTEASATVCPAIEEPMLLISPSALSCRLPFEVIQRAATFGRQLSFSLQGTACVNDMSGVEINRVPGNHAARDRVGIVGGKIQFRGQNGLAVDGGFFPPDDTFGQRRHLFRRQANTQLQAKAGLLIGGVVDQILHLRQVRTGATHVALAGSA